MQEKYNLDIIFKYEEEIGGNIIETLRNKRISNFSYEKIFQVLNFLIREKPKNEDDINDLKESTGIYIL